LSNYTEGYADEVQRTLSRVDVAMVERLVDRLENTKVRRGRVYMLGVGGNAADCTHAVADFRKLCKIDAYAATDNVSEVTAITNDTAWCHTFIDYLRGCHLTRQDLVFVLSVGGGSATTSLNIAMAVRYASNQGVDVVAITGPDGGETALYADACVKVPATGTLTTAITHGLQMVLLHGLFSHPRLTA
jgi:D-sedoheptulose 7-phosphate isomerase